jgi:hypothetical protein
MEDPPAILHFVRVVGGHVPWTIVINGNDSCSLTKNQSCRVELPAGIEVKLNIRTVSNTIPIGTEFAITPISGKKYYFKAGKGWIRMELKELPAEKGEKTVAKCKCIN